MEQKKISPEELQKKMADKDTKIICVDVRTEVEHNFSRIPGTINIPLDQLHNHIAELKKYDEVVLHCASGSRSEFACNVLPGQGCGEVMSLDGGIMAWEKAGLSVIRAGKSRLPIMRQVFITAGMLILTGHFAFYLLGNVWFLIFPIAVGLGLTYAGMSGNCLMSKLLVKMPWNQASKD